MFEESHYFVALITLVTFLYIIVYIQFLINLKKYNNQKIKPKSTAVGVSQSSNHTSDTNKFIFQSGNLQFDKDNMGNKNAQVQKDYKPTEPNNASQSYIANKNQPPQVPAQNQRILRQNINNLNVYKEQPRQVRESNASKGIKNSTLNVQQSNAQNLGTSIMRQSPAPSQYVRNTQRTEKNIKVSQSSIKLIENNPMRSELMISAMNVSGFEGEEFKGKRIKKFNIEADIPEKDLIKQEDYFDQSVGDLSLKPQLPIRVADFNIGNFGQTKTLAIKTYLFDHALNDKLVS